MLVISAAGLVYQHLSLNWCRYKCVGWVARFL